MKNNIINNISSGIYVFENVINKSDNIVENLNGFLNNKEKDFDWRRYQVPDQWRPAYVGYAELVPEYRDAWDFKTSSERLSNVPINETTIPLIGAVETVSESVKRVVKEYSDIYRIDMQFMEAINFIKYGPGQHFTYHSDHGWSYVCTVSTVLFLNDDFEGGELRFEFFDLSIKPKAGDCVVFPSTYLYSHASLPVISGTKYSAVTMFDYQPRTEYKKEVLGN